MKTFQNQILNPVLGWIAISALLSGCDLTSLKSTFSHQSARSSNSTSTGTTTSPADPSLPPSGQSTGRHDSWGIGSGAEFGGHSSKKQSSQKASWSEPSFPSHPSHPSFPSDPSVPSGPSGNSDPANSWGTDPLGNAHDPYARERSGATHASAPVTPTVTTAQNESSHTGHAGTSESSESGSAEAGTIRRPIGQSCSGTQDSGEICLALKYVSYVDGNGDNVETERDAVRDVEYANQIWRDCGIQFQLEDFQSAEPSDFDLRYRTRNYEELNEIRGTFTEPGELLVVATGKWDRAGSLGNSWANAWTNLPGERIYGVVLERTVTNYPQILAHELGHYLSLDHQNDPSSLMSPVVGRNSVELSRQECQEARWAARSYWREMMR